MVRSSATDPKKAKKAGVPLIDAAALDSAPGTIQELQELQRESLFLAFDLKKPFSADSLCLVSRKEQARADDGAGDRR